MEMGECEETRAPGKIMMILRGRDLARFYGSPRKIRIIAQRMLLMLLRTFLLSAGLVCLRCWAMILNPGNEICSYKPNEIY